MFWFKLVTLVLVNVAGAQFPPVDLGCAVFAPTPNPAGLVVAFGAGLPYTVFITSNPDDVQLTDSTLGLYSCFITVDGMQTNDSQSLRDYQEKYNVRHIVMQSNRFGTASTVRSTQDSLLVPDNDNTAFLEGIVRRGTNWPRRNYNLNVYSNMGSGDAAVPIVTDGAGAVVAFAENYTLHVASALDDSHLTSLALQHVALQYLLRGHGEPLPLLGHRRQLAGLQVDDFFAPPGNNPERVVTTDDMQWWVDWLAEFNAKHGSNIKPELAMNGLGLKEFGRLSNSFGSYPPGQVDNYSMAGTRENVYNNLWEPGWWNDSSFWTPWIDRDDEISRVGAGIRRNHNWKDSFLWLSHTFTHAQMGALGPGDSYAELEYSMKFAEVVLDLAGHQNWSPKGLITGQYSGMHNGEVFAAMDQLGMNSALSDSCNPAHDWSMEGRENYVPWYLTVNVNGYTPNNSIWIVPRHCTAVAFDAATFEQNLAYWDYETIEDLMESEVNRHSSQIMALRHDPYMFHQANMVVQPYQDGSQALLSMWTEFVVSAVSDYMAIPVVSEGQDRIADLFNLRFKYDECNPKVSVRRADGALSYIKISTETACSIAFEGLGSVPEQTSGNRVIVNTEGPYTWITVSSGDPVEFGTEDDDPNPNNPGNPNPGNPTPGNDDCTNGFTDQEEGDTCWWDHWNPVDRSCAACAVGGCQCGHPDQPQLGVVCVACGDTASCEVEYENFLECKMQGPPKKLLPKDGYDQPPRAKPRPLPATPNPTACLNGYTTSNTGDTCEDSETNQESMGCGECIAGSCQCGSMFGPLGGRVCVPCEQRSELCLDYVTQFQNCIVLKNIL
eukprot:Clim_evm7s31 gene=Clim_evmTU7s31